MNRKIDGLRCQEVAFEFFCPSSQRYMNCKAFILINLNLDVFLVPYHTFVVGRAQISYNDHSHFLVAPIVCQNTILQYLCQQVMRGRHRDDTNEEQADDCFYELEIRYYQLFSGYGPTTIGL